MSIYKGNNLISEGVAPKKEIYTTEETVIGTWIDGKPIYRRVFTGDFGTIGTSFINLTSKISTINKTNINMILNVWAKGIYQGNIYQYSSGFKYESRNDNNYYIQMLGSDVQNVDTIIIEYTKTTD